MATIYNIKLVSHWVNYSEKELKKLLEDAIITHERKKGNNIAIQIEVKRD